MSDEEQEKIVAAIPVPPMGFLAQVKKGVEITFATKKAAVAAYALFFGVTVGTAGMTAGGMTSAERQERVVLEETIVTLQTQITELENVHTNGAHEHDVAEHKHPELVALVDLSNGTTPPHAHEFVPHSHEASIHEHEAPAPAFIDMAHEHPAHEHDTTHDHDTTHEHKKAPSEEEANLSENYKHKDSRHDTCARSCH